MITGSIQNNWK